VKGENSEDESVRVDVWTWATRLFKTRDLSAAACKKEQILVNGQRCRASRQIRVGDRLEVRRGLLTRTVEVKTLLSKRVGASAVDDYLIDHTPKEVYEAAAEAFKQAREATPQRASGAGRPTKRERRDLEEIMEEAVEEKELYESFVKSFTRRS